MCLITRFIAPGARRAGFLIASSSSRSVLLWHRPSKWSLQTIKTASLTTSKCLGIKGKRMDGLFAIHWPQSMAAPLGEANGGPRHNYITQRHAVEEYGGDQLHNGALAVRVYLSASCLVSVNLAICITGVEKDFS